MFIDLHVREHKRAVEMVLLLKDLRVVPGELTGNASENDINAIVISNPVVDQFSVEYCYYSS
jgi:hypothetical protein